MSKVIVVGGGPAGMFAAIAAERGHEVVLLEKNEKLGKKLYITGKGRCNITNAGDMDTLFANVMTNPKFLYSAFYDYDNQRVIDFFEENGLATKVERGIGSFFGCDRHAAAGTKAHGCYGAASCGSAADPHRGRRGARREACRRKRS